jgi:hypothetical protein
MKNMSNAYHKPPSYDIKGIDYATEGAITLNQVYNILGETPEKLDLISSVSDSTGSSTPPIRSISSLERRQIRDTNI